MHFVLLLLLNMFRLKSYFAQTAQKIEDAPIRTIGFKEIT